MSRPACRPTARPQVEGLEDRLLLFVANFFPTGPNDAQFEASLQARRYAGIAPVGLNLLNRRAGGVLNPFQLAMITGGPAIASGVLARLMRQEFDFGPPARTSPIPNSAQFRNVLFNQLGCATPGTAAWSWWEETWARRSISMATLTPEERFVQNLFNAYLGRDAPGPELRGVLRRLRQVGFGGVAADLVRHPESLLRTAMNLFPQLLNRKGELGEAQQVAAILQTGGTLETATAHILASPEYFRRARSWARGDAKKAFVLSLYLNLLGRTPSSGLLARDVARLGAFTAKTRQRLAERLLRSAEYRSNQVTSFHYALLSRAPTGAELSALVNSGADLLTLEAQVAGKGEALTRII